MGNNNSKQPDKIIVNNTPPINIKSDTNMSTLNLSLEEILKEISIVVLIVFLWEYIKKLVNKKIESSNNKLARALSTNNINLNGVQTNN